MNHAKLAAENVPAATSTWEATLTHWSRQKRSAPRVMAIMLFLAAVLIPWVAGDFGSAWDDAVQQEYGQRSLNFFLTAGQDRSANDLLDLKYYGPLVEMLIAAVSRWLPSQLVFLRHTVSACLALMAAPALFRLGRLMGNRWIGVGAMGLLLLAPRFCGHAFVNTKDIPFAVGMAASLALLTAMYTRGRFSWREIVFSGIAIGITLAIRPGGALLLGMYYLVLTVFVDGQTWLQPATNWPKKSSRTLLKQAALLVVAWAVMVLPWPWAWESPIQHPLQAIRMASKFHLVMPVLFEGTTFASDNLPRYYLARFVLMTVPLGTFLLAVVGMILGGVQLSQHPFSRRARVLTMLLAWPLLPLVLFAVLRPNAYDGMRHFLFIIPPLVLWAAYGAWRLLQLPSLPCYRWSMATALVAVCVMQGTTVIAWHPYQSTYFNRLAGTSSLEQTFETDYWLLSYKEAMAAIRADIASNSNSSPSPRRILLAANDQSQACAANFADPEWQLTSTLDACQGGDLPPGFDYYIGTTRGGMAYNFPDAEVVQLIERPGVVLTAVKRARRLGAKSFDTDEN